jgi:hypothetical protein
MIYFLEYSQQVIQGIIGKDQGDERLSQKTKKELEAMTVQQKKLFKHFTKNIVATVYMCDQFPLKLDQLFPILDILSNVSPQITRLKEFLENKNILNNNSFPLKAHILIFFSINAAVSIRNFKLQ